MFIFALLSKSSRRVFKYPKIANSRLIFVSVFLSIIVPSMVYSFLRYGSFNSPDCYLYITDSDLLTQRAHIPSPLGLVEDPYYSGFPIFTVILNTISQVSGMSPTLAMYVIDLVTQILFWACVWLLLARVRRKESGEYDNVLSIAVVAFADVYLYGYLGIPIPQTLGISVLFLMLCIFDIGSVAGWICFVLISILGLVHIGMIPFLLMILIPLFLLRFFKLETRFRLLSLTRENLATLDITKLVLPFIIFTSYLLFTPALTSAINYLAEIGRFLASLQYQLFSGQLTATEGTSRVLAPLNALAPAFILGSNLAFVAWSIINERRTHEPMNSLHVWISIVSMVAIAAGSLRQRFNVISGYASMGRYFALPGYALAAVGTVIVLNAAVFPLVLDKDRNFLLRACVIVALTLVIIGGFLDPLIFGIPQS